MSITDQEMEHLKTLARLELSTEETQGLKQDLNKILGYFEQIRDLDTEGVEELARPVASANIFREDTPRPSLPRDESLGLAVEEDDSFFKVPRTVE